MLTFLQICWQITLELAPWLLLGAVAGGLLHVALPAGWLSRQLTGGWGVVKSVVLGVPLPLCSCGVIPVGLGLKKGGASSGSAVGFLISTPQTGVDSILVSGAMLGWPFALFKVVAAAVTGVVGGWLTEAVEKPRAGLAVLQEPAAAPARRTPGEAIRYALMLLQSIWRWLAIGVIASALITQFLPADAFAGLGRAGGLAAMLLTLLVATPLYVCATASVPIAASLVASGLPTGAALVFLMAGPATNVATIGAVRKTLGGRALAIYLAVIIFGSIAAGVLFEAVLPNESVVAAIDAHRHDSWWAAVCAALLLALCVRFAWQEATTTLGRRRMTPGGPEVSVDVAGMTCHGCVSQLEQTLRSSPNVDRAYVDLSAGRAWVTGAATPQELHELVRKAGFTPLG